MMTTEEVGCLRSDVGRQKAEVGTTELRRETNTNLTDDTNMRELRRETNTIATPHSQRENLTDGTNMRDHGDERTQMTRIKRIYGTTELRRELVPAISNLIFVRSTQERVSERDHIILADEQYFSFKDNKKL